MSDKHDIEAAGLADYSKDVCRIATVLEKRDEIIDRLRADNKALLEENERLKEFLSTALRGRPTEEDLAWADDQIAKIEAAHAQKEHSEPQ